MGNVTELPPPAWMCPYGCGAVVRSQKKSPLRGGYCPKCYGALTDEALDANQRRMGEVRRAAFLEAAGIVEDARNADIELCDMLTEQIRAKAAEQ